MESSTMALSREIQGAIQALDFNRMRHVYGDQNECLFLERFLPPAVVEHELIPEVERLRPHVQRWAPGQGKVVGGVQHDVNSLGCRC